MLMPSVIPAAKIRWQHGRPSMAWTALSAHLHRWQSRVSSLGWRFGGARDQEYLVLILTPEGDILDEHILTCADDEEAKETVKLLRRQQYGGGLEGPASNS